MYCLLLTIIDYVLGAVGDTGIMVTVATCNDRNGVVWFSTRPHILACSA